MARHVVVSAGNGQALTQTCSVFLKKTSSAFNKRSTRGGSPVPANQIQCVIHSLAGTRKCVSDNSLLSCCYKLLRLRLPPSISSKLVGSLALGDPRHSLLSLSPDPGLVEGPTGPFRRLLLCGRAAESTVLLQYWCAAASLRPVIMLVLELAQLRLLLPQRVLRLSSLGKAIQR